MYDVCLPYLGKFPYPGFFGPGFLQGFIHDLIPGLPYPRNFPYPIKASIYNSEYIF